MAALPRDKSVKVRQKFHYYCNASSADFSMIPENRRKAITRFVNSLYTEMYNCMAIRDDSKS